MKKTGIILLIVGAMACLYAAITNFGIIVEPKVELGSSNNRFTGNPTTDTVVAVGTSRVLALVANSSRSYALFTNDSDTAVYLCFNSASTTPANYSVRLNASGGTYEMDSDNLYIGAVFASSTVANKNIKILEY